MIGRFFRALWRGITVLRLALANLLFIALLAGLWFILRGAPPAPPLPDRAALLLDLEGRVVDQQRAVAPLSLLSGDGATGELLLTDLIDAVDYARDDARINALVLDLDRLVYIGQSKALELAAAIERFRDTGKAVVAVGDYFSQDQYRLAVEADDILMHPLGAVALEGYSSYVNYFGEALDKLSVNVHIFRAGEHKSFGEPFQRSDMSAGEKAITAKWLEQLWSNYVRDIESRRALRPGSIDALINNYPARLREASGDTAQLALDSGLVDRVLGREERAQYLRELVGAENDEGEFQRVGYRRYLTSRRPTALRDDGKHIAIVTGTGIMYPGEQEAGSIGGDSLAAILRAASERDDVAAIVLRVNTPGGSVLAAEVIREEIALIRAAGLPVVISMGSVAASGGYYIAAEADRIYATEATLTGSIGVFAAFPTVEDLLARGGIYTDGVGTTELAGGLRPDRPLHPRIAEALQLGVDRLHEDFIGLVAAGRGLAREVVVPVADGRAIAAGDALDLGLVDALGGLEAAVEGAAELAGVSDYQVISIDPPLTPQQVLLQRISDMVGAGRLTVQAPLPDAAARWVRPVTETAALLSSFADPRHLYMRCLNCGI